MAEVQQDWIVMKFGGTSVSTRERWHTIERIVRKRMGEGLKPLVVCSAVSGISRKLDALMDESIHGQSDPILEEIKTRHLDLAADLGLDGEALLATYFEKLARLSLGASLTREVTPHLRARVLATGELMATTLGAAYLNNQGLSAQWRDARDMLRSIEQPRMIPHQRYLSATCYHDPDPDLRADLAGTAADLILTQGFIAGNKAGETVLVGWGGSDTSAAYFASKILAQRLEIWTDVPGMFTANPRQIPSARLLQQLDYDEAQELASTGAEVLHPRCLDPVRSRQIPLLIQCTQAPDMEGTVISDDVPGVGALVKAISSRPGITLIVMETPRMWHQVGFLARAFAVFERHALSIDLVATSETNVTVSIDTIRNAELDPTALEALLADLNAFCTAREIGPCAAVSLVGSNLRSLLHELGPALEVFDEQHIYLVTQAANDLNFTFVIDEEHAERLVRKLHAQLFDRVNTDRLFGPSWRELFGEDAVTPTGASAWWRARRNDLTALAEETSPLYVYDETTLRASAGQLQSIDAVDRAFYAIKANPNPDVLRIFYEAGLGFECVSPGELSHVRALFADLDPQRLLFTPNFAPREDYAFGLSTGAYVTLDNLHPLEAWPALFRNRDIIVRVDPGRGHGHHKHVRTAGAQSKFGVAPSEMERLRERADATHTRIIGFHAHVGSGIAMAETWSDTAFFLASLTDRFPDVRLLNVGGGLSVPERPGTLPLDVTALARGLSLFKQANPDFELWMEPGRFLVARAGVLLARVTQVKRKGPMRYVGIETGMNSLIRPALYGAYHEIVNLTRLDAPMAMTADVVGPICETGDVLGHSRRLPETHEGDLLLIATAGAYGHAMSSRYNLREPAAETLLRADPKTA
ncbi:MAG: bifunctional aspartate kinase/diaminopimelate decarboxylase [Rhodothermales bacterium]